MNIAVVGAGSLGMLFSGKCSHVQAASVTLYTRTKQQADEINRKGIAMTSMNGTTEEITLKAAKWGDHSIDPEPDVILLTVKQTHLSESFIQELAEFAKPDTMIICYQNGLGHMEKLEQFIPKKQLLYAVTTEAALKTGRTGFTHTGKGKTVIGNAEHNAVLSKTVNLLNEAGFHTELSKNIESFIWNKLLINACINPLTALFNVTNGELPKQNHWLELMKTLLAEGLSVSRRLNVDIDEAIENQLMTVCRQTGHNRSSMLQDLTNHKQTEIDYINGSIVRLADELGIEVPVQRAVWQMIKGLESRRAL